MVVAADSTQRPKTAIIWTGMCPSTNRPPRRKEDHCNCRRKPFSRPPWGCRKMSGLPWCRLFVWKRFPVNESGMSLDDDALVEELDRPLCGSFWDSVEWSELRAE